MIKKRFEKLEDHPKICQNEPYSWFLTDGFLVYLWLWLIRMCEDLAKGHKPIWSITGWLLGCSTEKLRRVTRAQNHNFDVENGGEAHLKLQFWSLYTHLSWNRGWFIIALTTWSHLIIRVGPNMSSTNGGKMGRLKRHNENAFSLVAIIHLSCAGASPLSLVPSCKLNHPICLLHSKNIQFNQNNDISILFLAGISENRVATYLCMILSSSL